MRFAHWGWVLLSLCGCLNFQSALEECVDAGLCVADSGNGGGSSGGGGGGTGGGGGGAAGGAANSHFTVTPGALTFVAREVDAGPTAQSLTVTNTGTAELSALSVRFMPTGGPFAFDSGCPAVLSADGGSCILSVLFNPSSEGDAGTNLVVGFADAGEQVVPVSASAYATVELVATVSAGGRVVSDDGGINCPGACARRYVRGSTVGLTPQPAPRFGLRAVAGGGCSTSGPCAPTLVLDRTEVVWEFDRFNLIFATSFTVPGDFATRASSISLCLAAAADAGLGTHFAPIVSDFDLSSSPLPTARGWMRPDGQPVADTFGELLAGNLSYPPDQDERGRRLQTFLLLTGLNGDGGRAPTSCNMWTDANVGSTGRIGSAAASGQALLSVTDGRCSSPGRILCAEHGHRAIAVTAARPSGSRLAFLSEPYGLTSDADAVCRVEAAGLPRASSFVALRSQRDGGAAVHLLSPGGSPWYRIDGVAWSRPEILFDAGFSSRITLSPLNRLRDGGAVLDPSQVWTGGSPLSTPDGTFTFDCDRWQVASASATVGNPLTSGTDNTQDDHAFLGRPFSRLPCTGSARFYCVEN